MKIFNIVIACFSRLSVCVAECVLSFLSVAFSQGPLTESLRGPFRKAAQTGRMAGWPQGAALGHGAKK